jgi:N-acyl-D-amino-acid deacylase
MDFDLVIKNGTIVDGTGQDRFAASLGISGGKIAAISRDDSLNGRQVLDATGLIVAPGFIDLHSHSDWVLPLRDHDQVLAPLVLQGITTIVGGQCGFSPAPVTDESIPALDTTAEILRTQDFDYAWRSMDEFLATLERDGLLLNTALLVGHGALRYIAMEERADSMTPPSVEEVDAMCHLVSQAIQEGAFGLSAGLAYAPGVFAQNWELEPILRTVAEEGGLFAVHGRAYSWLSPFYKPLIGGTPHNVRSVRELLSLAHQSGVRLQLSHQIFVGRRTWRTYPTVLRAIERAVDGGIDVAFDASSFTKGISTIKVVFPDWFLDNLVQNIRDPRALRRLKLEMLPLRWLLGLEFEDITLMWGAAPELEELEGLGFSTIARKLGMSPADAYVHVAQLSNCQASVLLGTYSGDDKYEDPLRAVLSHPLCAFITDSVLTQKGVPDPACYGAFPRVLGRYSRDLGLFSLEEAVHRMTGWPAERLGLIDVGCIAEGAWADLVLFEPNTVADRAISDKPATPAGICAVLISGNVVAQDGQLVGRERQGRVLRK